MYVCMYVYLFQPLSTLKLTLVLRCTFHIAFILPFTCYTIYIILLSPILLYPILVFILTMLFFRLLKYLNPILPFYFMFILLLSSFRTCLTSSFSSPCLFLFFFLPFYSPKSHFTASFPSSSLSISSRRAFVISISLQSLQCSNVPTPSSRN